MSSRTSHAAIVPTSAAHHRSWGFGGRRRAVGVRPRFDCRCPPRRHRHRHRNRRDTPGGRRPGCLRGNAARTCLLGSTSVPCLPRGASVARLPPGLRRRPVSAPGECRRPVSLAPRERRGDLSLPPGAQRRLVSLGTRLRLLGVRHRGPVPVGPLGSASNVEIFGQVRFGEAVYRGLRPHRAARPSGVTVERSSGVRVILRLRSGVAGHAVAVEGQAAILACSLWETGACM